MLIVVEPKTVGVRRHSTDSAGVFSRTIGDVVRLVMSECTIVGAATRLHDGILRYARIVGDVTELMIRAEVFLITVRRVARLADSTRGFFKPVGDVA